jgi:hypothetical protein
MKWVMVELQGVSKKEYEFNLARCCKLARTNKNTNAAEINVDCGFSGVVHVAKC